MEKGLKKLLIMIGFIFLGTVLFTCYRNTKSNTKYEDQIVHLQSMLKEWGEKNPSFLPPLNQSITIPLRTLKQSDLIEEDFTDPKTRRKFSNQLLMQIKKGKKGYEYEVLESYEYMIEDYDDVKKNAPMVVLKGEALEYAELNTKYIDPGFMAITKEGKKEDESHIIITCDEKEVSFLDTSKLATYQITYQVLYAKEKSEVTRTVIVRDTEKPNIEMDRLIVTPDEVQDLNLLKDVKITDNSNGNLSIKTIGTLSSIPGKYVITYQVMDASMNMREKKRVIRVVENKDLIEED